MTEVNNVQVLEQAIMEIAQQEAQSILEEARSKTDAIHKQAKVRAEAESTAILHAAEQQVPHLIEQAGAKAQVEAQMIKLQRREQVIERAFAAARHKLTMLPQRPDYADIVRHLLDEAITVLDNDTCIVHADAQTQTLLTDAFLAAIARERHVTLRRGDLLTEGAPLSSIGIVLSTPDGKRRYDNTFEARLARIQDSLRTEVYRILAGEMQ